MSLIFPRVSKQLLTATLIFAAAFFSRSFSQKISGGGSHSLLICSDGVVKGWGDNYYGQLGYLNNLMGNTAVPVVVPGLSGTITAVSAGGYHSLALKSDSTVWAWGNNSNGQLGDGTTTSSEIPAQVLGLSKVVAISAGYYYSLALKSDGTVWAWGYNGYGQLGDSTTTQTSLPVKARYLVNIIAISAGETHALALRSDSTVWSWGYNYDGQLGLGTNSDSIYPCKVPGLSKIIAIDAGGYHSLALKSTGTVMGWGYNWNGQVGNGNQTSSPVPLPVASLNNVKAISAGGNHSMALKNDSTVWQWGEDLGTGGCFKKGGSNTVLQNNGLPVTFNLTAMKVQGLANIIALGSGSQHALALRNDETGWAWGHGSSGKLGNGDYSNYPNPVQAHCICGSIFPTVSASADVTICPGQNKTISGTVSGGNGGPFSYQWSPNTNINCTTCANAMVKENKKTERVARSGRYVRRIVEVRCVIPG